MQTELKCFQCNRVGGINIDGSQVTELTMYDFGVDVNSGAVVCKDCYTSPKDNVVKGKARHMVENARTAEEMKGIALHRANARASERRG